MAKLNLDDLKKMRDEKRREMNRRDTDKSIEIIIGMGTCGIAAGAKEAFDAFVTAIDASNLDDVMIKQTGCMGFCANEPTVEVRMPEMPDTIYNNVDATIAERIVKEHILEQKMVSEYVFDKPSVDIVDGQ
ncbi:(2Fe-2S) ferredoxin domain-containing protein [Chitinivibrio alkaliphilus]|uniref:Fe-only hydrogenase, subunit HydD n=1 Tax=Chitinivibrio alkaliphilus ACht1 TaxID=1313304 RepID=U7D7T4_9BACT|nr:Fe-only hydrogenase subunit HydD [Chitinivibrio alkaliphilus]ERP31998.1 Fe-only hydrogenase, subunit HydD [Chitinivibrio alkaliphilus ACht1]